ncbi:MAG TPA: HEAT repeat domain-containing protein [Myxococcota bacterium]|nr:HEAT repeat domain-containing protein [Myxococcota bacterium]
MSHPLLADLQSADPAQRAAACRGAARDPAGALLAEALVSALADPEPAVARAARAALVDLARASDGVLPLLRRALRSEPPQARIHAALALARLEPPGPPLLPALVDALAATERELRWAAARVLVDMGRLHGEVLGVLLGLVGTAERPAARRMASFALRELAPDRPEAARVLLAATRDGDVAVRRAAVLALAGLLDPPREVAARLAELRDDRDPALARLAGLALGGLEKAEARR